MWFTCSFSTVAAVWKENTELCGVFGEMIDSLTDCTLGMSVCLVGGGRPGGTSCVQTGHREAAAVPPGILYERSPGLAPSRLHSRTIKTKEQDHMHEMAHQTKEQSIQMTHSDKRGALDRTELVKDPIRGLTGPRVRVQTREVASWAHSSMNGCCTWIPVGAGGTRSEINWLMQLKTGLNNCNRECRQGGYIQLFHMFLKKCNSSHLQAELERSHLESSSPWRNRWEKWTPSPVSCFSVEPPSAEPHPEKQHIYVGSIRVHGRCATHHLLVLTWSKDVSVCGCTSKMNRRFSVDSLSANLKIEKVSWSDLIYLYMFSSISVS